MVSFRSFSLVSGSSSLEIDYLRVRTARFMPLFLLIGTSECTVLCFIPLSPPPFFGSKKIHPKFNLQVHDPSQHLVIHTSSGISLTRISSIYFFVHHHSDDISDSCLGACRFAMSKHSGLYPRNRILRCPRMRITKNLNSR